MLRDVLRNIHARLVELAHLLSEKQIQILRRIDPFAEKVYQSGYAAGQRAGVEIGIDETIDAYDELLRRRLAA